MKPRLRMRNIRYSLVSAITLFSLLSLVACGGGGGGGGSASALNDDATVEASSPIEPSQYIEPPLTTEPSLSIEPSQPVEPGSPKSPPTGLVGCADTDSCFSNPSIQIGGDRPAKVLIPSDYNTSTQYPLVVLLHGMGGWIDWVTSYFGLDNRVDSKQYILVIPEGTENFEGVPYWNATPACCAISDEEFQVDDVAYIRQVIEEAAANYSIDSSRIGIFGGSNGAFMALRMACDASELVTSVVSMAGSTFADDASCATADDPVSVLLIHGLEDKEVPYEGGYLFGKSVGFPGALETARRFAAHAGCNSMPTLSPEIDVLGDDPAADTQVLDYSDCAGGSEVTLWSIAGGTHVPFPWTASALDLMVDWIVDHQSS